MKNAARLAYDVYEGFRSKKQTLAVVVDQEDVYSRKQFKLLMELLVQYGFTSQDGLHQRSRIERLPCDLETGSPRSNE